MNSTALITSAQEILRTLVLLLAPRSVAELRCPKTAKGTISGYFDDWEKMATAATDLSGKVPGVYMTLNPVDPALLCRAVNRVKPWAKVTTRDEEILSRRWLPLDFDTVRPAGISATDTEHASALAKAEECKVWLTTQGWPQPLFGDSGNGAHLLYRIDLPNDEPVRLLVEKGLAALAQRFSDGAVTIDTAVGNAARIWKLYGTLACKGDRTADRPHRFARLLEVPEAIEVVTLSQLEAIAAPAHEELPLRPITHGSSGKGLDAASWLAKFRIEVESQEPYQGGQKFILANCPLNPEHRGSAFVIQFPSGALSAGCLHESCKSLNWKTVREIYEPRSEAPAFSDDAVALRFVQEHGAGLRYTASMGSWHCWTGMHWQRDETLTVFERARLTCRTAAMTAEPDKARRLASAATIAAVEKLARADSSLVVGADRWDADPWLLNCPGGTVELRTGEMRAHRRDDLITKTCRVSPGDAGCPLWKTFLARATDGKPELQSYLQRMAGYCATGSTSEQALFFLYGTGANGKSVFLSTVTAMLEPYCAVAPIEMLLDSRNSADRHPTDLAGLRGKRLVTAVEVGKGRRWQEEKLKNLTGGDRVTARFMRGDFFEFSPVFKLLIAANHRPTLRSVDEAIRRRFQLVPFVVTIPENERDHDLSEKLKAEWPGILRWIIEGCLAWQREGLNPPAVARRATADYFGEEDTLGRWIEERCTLGAQYDASGKALFADWKMWAEAAGEYVGSQKAFGQQLEAREGIARFRSSRERGYLGIRLRTPEDADTVIAPPVQPDAEGGDFSA